MSVAPPSSDAKRGILRLATRQSLQINIDRKMTLTPLQCARRPADRQPPRPDSKIDDAEVCDQADDRHHDQEREPLLVRHATPRGPRSSTT
jgi:hypothetical protein